MGMKFLHTSDWHLGRLFHGVNLTEDQRHVLLQLLEVVRDEKPDALLVAGDIYDRAVPPPEAVDLLDEIFTKLLLELRVPVVVIAGNHDSPNRLGFASKMLSSHNLWVCGNLPATLAPLVLNDQHGPVDIFSLPYAEPSMVRQWLGQEATLTHQSAMDALISRLPRTQGRRSVLMAHAFVAGGRGCESERPLSVGGSGAVEASCFDGFDYVALGHLHAPQSMGDGIIQYSGSPLQYSFDEAHHHKSVSLVEMDQAGKVATRRVALSPKRKVRRLRDTFERLCQLGLEDAAREDYLEITYTDESPILDVMARLRQVYPNCLYVSRLLAEQEAGGLNRWELTQLDDLALFDKFYQESTGQPLSEEAKVVYRQVVERMYRQLRQEEP